MERPIGRKLHTIAGSVVLAAFLVEHIVTQASALGGAGSYDRVVGAMERWPGLPFVEVLFIALPLGFHAIYGFVSLRKPTPDTEAERYGDQRFLVIQRISATLVLLFLLGHLFELRLNRLFFGLGKEALYTTLTAHLSSTWGLVPWISLLYLMGIAAVCFHLANGLRASFGWKRFNLVLAASLFVVGFLTVLAFATGTQLWQGAPIESPVPCGSAVPTAPSRP
jgi:succinate dehydrogenase / fumarate reductase cytochrome b subunit